MKYLKIITLCFSIAFTFPMWSASTFTNIAELGQEIYAGVKTVETGMEMNSYLLAVKVKDLSSRKISLPSEVENREIVGLFPSEEKTLLVVTQNTRGGGDKPLIHEFHSTLNSWKKVGEVDCTSFAAVKALNSSLEFSCEVTSEKGEVKHVLKKVETKVSLKTKELKLPVTKIESNEVSARLVEEDLDWTKLQITKDKEVKVFTP